MQDILLVVHVVISISIVALVLLQKGKGADMGTAFGSGASATVFGSQGSASFLTRATAVLATLFFALSIMLAYLSGQEVERRSVTENMEQTGAVDTDLPEDIVPVEPPTESAPADDVPVP